MKRKLIWTLSLLTASLCAQVVAPPRKVEQDLNALGKEGFRVVPSAMRTKPHLLERDTTRKQAFSYRVLEAKDVAALEKAVNEADREGYEPVGYVGHVHVFVPDFYLVLEKPE